MAKASLQKKTVRTVKKRSKKTSNYSKSIYWLLFLGVFVFGVYHYRNAILFYFSFKSDKVLRQDKVTQARIFQILQDNKDKVLGLDLSEYQGKIDWTQLDSIEGRKIHFVFIRATVGNDKVDARFKENWKSAKENHFIRGAYHYYRPNENSMDQARLFIKTVQLKNGDLPPVLDIEKLPKTQSIDSLKVGLKRFLAAIDNHYKVKPIIYSGERYYEDFLKDEFEGYTFWVANYNFFVEQIKDEWLFWQFTQKAVVKGINHKVDVNIYNGTPKMLDYLRISK